MAMPARPVIGSESARPSAAFEVPTSVATRIAGLSQGERRFIASQLPGRALANRVPTIIRTCLLPASTTQGRFRCGHVHAGLTWPMACSRLLSTESPACLS